MKPTMTNKMDDFFEKAEETLKNVNNSAEEVRKTSGFLKWIIGLTVLVFLGLYTDIKIGLGTKADAHDVVFKQNALVVEKLRVDNSERNFAVVIDTTSKMELIQHHNQNYIWSVEGIYDLNYRNKE